jgi:crossover junction endodeoxyribonuclease RusA
VNVTLSWPPKELSPNARVHRLEKARIAKRYRQACAWECKEQGLGIIAAWELHLDITFCPPDARLRDLDNMLASIKAGLDGIADVTGVDDIFWSMTIRRGRVKPGEGAVEIAILADAPRAVAVELRGAIK